HVGFRRQQLQTGFLSGLLRQIIDEIESSVARRSSRRIWDGRVCECVIKLFRANEPILFHSREHVGRALPASFRASVVVVKAWSFCQACERCALGYAQRACRLTEIALRR